MDTPHSSAPAAGRWPAGVYVEARDGRWLPAVPLPYCHGPSWRWSIKGCDCGRKFLTLRGYERHYRLVHLPAPVISAMALHEAGWAALLYGLGRRCSRGAAR